MRRQLYRGGGITRQRYGLGDLVRKLIPNEIADVAVKAAPFVAPFNPAVAAAMRGIGRYDQRGSLSDAFKQAALTYGGGQLVRGIGGAPLQTGNPFTQGGAFTKEGFKSGFSSPLDEGRMEGVRNFFSTPERSSTSKALEKGSEEVGIKGIRKAAKNISKIPGLGNISDLAKQQLLVGTVSGGLTYMYEKFFAEEKQLPGESYGEFLARRKRNVAKKMRAYKDNYLSFDKDWSSMTDEEKDEQINTELSDYDVEDANMNQGGRVGYQTGGITMANTLAENIRRNQAQAASINQRLTEARTRLNEIRPGRIASQSQLQQEANKIAAEEVNQMTGGKRGIPSIGNVAPTNMDIQAAIAANYTPPPPPTDPLTGMLQSQMLPNNPDGSMRSIAEMDAISDRVLAAQAAQEGNKLTFQEALMGEDWNMLNDNDQYRFSQEYPGQTPPRRNPDFVPSMNQGGRVGLYGGGEPKEGIESLDAGAPDITYEGNEGPQAPQEEQQMAGMMDQISLAFEQQNGYDISLATPEVREEFIQKWKKENYYDDFSRGPVLPSPEDPINPFAPKPTGPALPDKMMAAQGGRIGYNSGSTSFQTWLKYNYGLSVDKISASDYAKYASEYQRLEGKKDPIRRIGQLGGTGPQGLPGIPRMASDGMEFDMRQNGGFQGLGAKEGKDDVPAMLAKNEFVFTADAVRGAGGGDIELGAQRMYDTMKNLEKRMA